MRNQLTLSMWFHLLLFAPNLVTRTSQTPIRTWTLLEYHHQKETDERDNTAENNEKGLCIQRKVERAGRTESTQSSSKAEDKILDNKQLQKITDNHYKKVNKSKTEMTRPVKRNTVIFLLREWVERKMEKTRAIVT